MVDGIRDAKLDDSNLAVYAQSAYDQGVLMLGLQRNANYATYQIREGLNALRRVFGDDNLKLYLCDLVYQNDPVCVTIRDLETLIRDSSHSGWLSGELIFTAIRYALRDWHVFTIDPNVWVAYVNHGMAEEMCPPLIMRHNPQFIIIPYHFTGHWALLIVNLRSSKVAFLDSKERAERRAEVQRQVLMFLNQKQAQLGKRKWEILNATSHQQMNDYDCGVYVIENAVAIAEGNEDLPEVTGNMARLNIFSAMYNDAMHFAELSTAGRQQPAQSQSLFVTPPRHQQPSRQPTPQQQQRSSPLVTPQRQLSRQVTPQRQPSRQVTPQLVRLTDRSSLSSPLSDPASMTGSPGGVPLGGIPPARSQPPVPGNDPVANLLEGLRNNPPPGGMPGQPGGTASQQQESLPMTFVSPSTRRSERLARKPQ